MTTIKVGGTQVKVPETLDLEAGTPASDDAAPATPGAVMTRRAQFLALFPDACDPSISLPLEDVDVFVLDSDRASNFVHVAQYCKVSGCFNSDGGWFELSEVELWSYVPGIKLQRALAAAKK